MSLSAQGQALEFKPLQPWLANGLVEVFVDETARDLNGNALNNYQSSFRVAVDLRATAPRVVGSQPSAGSRTAPLNPVIDIQFSEALDPATVNSTSVGFTLHRAQLLASTVSLIKGGRVIRVVPQLALAANESYAVHMTTPNSIKDLDGQVLSPYLLEFSTAAGAVADTAAPQVETMSPPTGSQGVGINGHVHVRFDEAVNPLSLASDQGQTGYGSLFWSENNQSVEFVRHRPYAANSTVTETVVGVEDYAGNAVAAPYETTFKTGGGADFSVPTVLDGTPFNAATNVAVNAVLKLRFNELLDPVSVNASTAYVYSSQDGATVGSASLGADGQTISYVPGQALAVGHQYYLYAYGVKDLSGNVQYTYRYFITSFTPDTVGPVVTAMSLTDGLVNVPTNAALSVGFDEPVNEQSLAGLTVSLNSVAVASSMNLSSDHRMARLKLLQPLQANAMHVLSVAGVEDLSGNVLSVAQAVTFSTGAGVDLVAPAGVSVSPVNGATGVPLNTLIEARFNERLSAPEANEDSFVRLYDGTLGQYLDGRASVSADGLTVRFVPAAPLAANHFYYFYHYVNDLAGNRATPFSSFTTEAQ